MMRWLDLSVKILAILAGAILIGLVLLTFADVVMRYLYSAPVEGRQDVVEVGMVAVLCLAAPYAWRVGDHITVDILPEFRWPGIQFIHRLLIRLIVAGLLGLLAYTAYLRIEEAVLFNEATNIVQIPHQPFLILMSLAFLVHLLVVLAELFDMPRAGSAERQGGE